MSYERTYYNDVCVLKQNFMVHLSSTITQIFTIKRRVCCRFHFQWMRENLLYFNLCNILGSLCWWMNLIIDKCMWHSQIKCTFKYDARILLRGSIGRLEANTWAWWSVEKTKGNSVHKCLLDSKDNLNSATSAGTPSFGLFSGKTFLILIKAYFVLASKFDSIDSSILNYKTRKKKIAYLVNFWDLLTEE